MSNSIAVNKLLSIALKEVGATTGAQYNTWYWGSNNGAAWCAAFVSWCENQAGFTDIAGKYASCTAGINWFKSKGGYFTKAQTTPQPGDHIYFNWDGGTGPQHVGLVVSYDPAKKIVTTVEGNTSSASQSNGNCCQSKNRALTCVIGYGRPKYPEDTPVSMPITFTYTVVTGDSLSKIAARYNTTVADILKVNPSISNPNLIRVGQVITLPMKKGDVNGDGVVDTTDARIILQAAVGKLSLTDAQKVLADINGDGVIDTTDARLILQTAVGKATI